MAAHRVLICQNTACRRMGSAKVLTAFETQLAHASTDSSALSSSLPAAGQDGWPADAALDASVIDITVTGCHCLGECGNGPMVLVLPGQIWYHRIHPDEVAAIVRHLKIGKPLLKLLYPKFHSA